ncbi:MAG TPA: DsbA family protein [Acidobacteriota bacterium]|nr:DsbA family protein [Acidobacteriota bacterium]
MKIVSVLCLFLSGVYPLAAQAPAAKKPEAPASKPMVVATFNGKSITDEELRKVSAPDFDRLSLDVDNMNSNLQRIAHQIMETNLLHLLADKLFEAEAAKRGISKEAFLEKELQGKVKEPSPQDISAFYQANKQRFNEPLDDKVSERIQQFLRAEYRNKALGDLADRLKPAYAVKMLLPPARLRVGDEGSPSQGPKDAPVTIVEFSDFQCESCSQLSTNLHEIVVKYGNKVRWVYRQYPLSQVHPLAEKAAEASLCAADQNHFWELHDLMFNSQNALKEEDLKAKAAQLKLDPGVFNSCLASGKYAGKVKQDEREAYSLAVSNSPSFFVNGRYYTGAVPLLEISKTIDEELVLSSSGKQGTATGAAGSAGSSPSAANTPPSK